MSSIKITPKDEQIRNLDPTTEGIAKSLMTSTSRLVKNIAVRFNKQGVDREGVLNLKDLAPLVREIRATDKETYEELHDLVKRILFYIARDVAKAATTHIENRDTFANLRDIYAILADIRENEVEDLEKMTDEQIKELLNVEEIEQRDSEG